MNTNNQNQKSVSHSGMPQTELNPHTATPYKGDKFVWHGKPRKVSRFYPPTQWVYFTDGSSGRFNLNTMRPERSVPFGNVHSLMSGANPSETLARCVDGCGSSHISQTPNYYVCRSCGMTYSKRSLSPQDGKGLSDTRENKKQTNP